MFLFRKKDTCSICGSRNGKPVSDGFVCDECWKACGVFRLIGQDKKLARIKDVQSLIAENKLYRKLQAEREKLFTPNKVIGNQILIDEEHKLWSPTRSTISKKSTGIYFAYDDVLSFEVVEDGNTVTKGGLGRAIAGGILLGGVGAIVGGVTGKKNTHTTCSKLYLKLQVKHFYRDILLIYINREVKKDSIIYTGCYREMEKLLNFFNEIKDNSVKPSQDLHNNVVSDIKKYHDLFESGTITEEELDSIKSKLLAKL